MGRTYAGILGTLAMTVLILRGMLTSSGIAGTLGIATAGMVLFAIVGAILGQIAQATIDESVRAQLEDQLSRHATDTPVPE